MSNNQKITHAYCDVCLAIVPVTVGYMDIESSCKKYFGGYIKCDKCHVVIATVYKKKIKKEHEKNK